MDLDMCEEDSDGKVIDLTFEKQNNRNLLRDSLFFRLNEQENQMRGYQMALGGPEQAMQMRLELEKAKIQIRRLESALEEEKILAMKGQTKFYLKLK